MKKKIVRVTTIPDSLGGLLTGQLNYMSQHFEVIGISSRNNGVLEKVGSREGVRVIPVKMTRTITPLKDLKATWKLYKIFRKEKPFIVQTHTPKAGTLGMLAAYLARVPHRLHTIAGLPLLEATGQKRKILNLVEKITYACATKIYPNSYGLKQIIIEHKFTKGNKLKVIGNGSSNGIDTNHFNPELYTDADNEKLKLSLGIDKNDIVYIFVGRIVKDKGINELIKAFKKLTETHRNIKLLLVGGFEKDLDPVLPETEECIENNSQIIATDWQNDVRPYFAIANVLTFPSYREGFPNVVLQAGSMGLPSIVSNINGCNEIIEEGVNGYIVPVKNEEKLYESMRNFYDRSEANVFFDKKQLRELIANKYSRETIWKAILEEYNTL